MLGKKFQKYDPKCWWKIVMDPVVQSVKKSPKQKQIRGNYP